MATVDSFSPQSAFDAGYAAGVAAGRKQAADEVRAIAAEIRADVGTPGEWIPGTGATLAILIDGIAVRIAEGGEPNA